MESVLINPLHLTASTLHAETMAKFGMGIVRNAPSLADLRKRYDLDGFAGRPVRTWKDAATVLRGLKDAVDEASRELYPESMR